MSRPLFRGALAYPVVWAVPAIVACVLGARGDVPGSYRQRADAICAQATAVAPRAVAAYGPDGAVAVADRQLYELQRLSVPYVWRQRHAELVGRFRTQMLWLRTSAVQVRTARHPRRELAAAQRRMAVMAQADRRALAALGYHACAA